MITFEKLQQVRDMIILLVASSVKWTVLGHPGSELNKIIFSPKPSGPFWATLSQIQERQLKKNKIKTKCL